MNVIDQLKTRIKLLTGYIKHVSEAKLSYKASIMRSYLRELKDYLAIVKTELDNVSKDNRFN